MRAAGSIINFKERRNAVVVVVALSPGGSEHLSRCENAAGEIKVKRGVQKEKRFCIFKN